MKIFYYTSTGNCLDVAKQFDAELYSIPQMLKENNLNFEDEKIGIVFPVYASTTPKVVVEFLEKFTLKTPYIFAICTYGSSSGAALNHFIKCANDRGINVSYTNQIQMPDNYLNFFEMQGQIDKYDDRVFRKNVRKIVVDVNNSSYSIKKSNEVVGAISPAIYWGFNKFVKKTAEKFTIETKCNLCGTCAKVCPMKNVTVSNKVTFGENCISCYGCTHNCPSNAIRVKGEKSKVRYRNPRITLKEIIDANNQN